MRKKLWLLSLAAVVLPLALVSLALLALGHSTPAKAGSLTALENTEDTEVDLGEEISAVSASVVQTWTHTTRADWEQGTLDWLDSATVSGSLGLMQRLFGESTTVTPREDLGAGQTDPDIAVDGSGNAYAVWEDGRNGHADIYFAYRAAVSTTWSASIRVNDDGGIAQQSTPAIAVDVLGNAYVVWTDDRKGDTDIYFAYRPAGGNWGVNAKVNDDPGTARQVSPAIAVDSNGNAYAVWDDERDGDTDIYFATRPVGGSWGANIKVNDDPGSAGQYSSAIAVDSSGNAYAVWTDKRNGNEDIYFAYHPTGGSWGANVQVSDDPGTEWQWEPDVAVDGSGDVYVIWSDLRNRNSDWDIYFAYRPAGGNWSANVKVNDDVGTLQSSSTIAVDPDGNAYAAWNDFRNGNYDVYFATRPAEGNWGANLRVNDDTGTAAQYGLPAIAVDSGGNAYAAWTDERNGNPDIYSAARPLGGVWQANVRVDDDVSGAASQAAPSIAVDGSGNAYAIWSDLRNRNWDIYFAYRAAGESWGANVRVNDDLGTALQIGPSIAVDSSGNAYAVWVDARNGNLDIYFAYRPAGGDWETNIKINDDVGTAAQGSPDIAVDASGNAYAVWVDTRSGNYDVYSSYRPVGGSWGANVQVSDASDTVQKEMPDIAVDASGNAYAVWWYDPNDSADVYFAYHAAISTTWSADVKVNDDTSMARQHGPAIAVDASGNSYAVWKDGRNDGADIYFAHRPTGGNWETNIKVNDDSGMAYQGHPSIIVDAEGKACAVWEDGRTDWGDIYFACRPVGGEWGVNVRVNNDPGTAWQRSPAMAVDLNSNDYVVWQDEGYGTGHIHFAQSLTTPEYALEGQYTSPELDTGVTAATWESFTWQGSTPDGTSLAFETRSRIAGGAWSAWEPMDDAIASPPGQYLQYRVTFATSLTDTTPLLEQMQITYRSAGTPSAPRFATPCGVTNRTTPTLRGSATAGSVVRLYTAGREVATDTASAEGVFAFAPELSVGSYTLTATAENENGPGPASAPLTLTVDPALPYDPIHVRAGQWSKDGWLMSVPRDAEGCADPDNEWRIWPRQNQRLRVEVPVSYTTSAAVTVTVGTASITLTEESDGLFAGVFQPPIHDGDFVIEVNADGDTTTVDGGPVLIDPDGVVYEASGTISDTIPGVQVTCYYLDDHSGQWLTWDAWTYDQVNPQVTLDDGYYSFYTPPGTYRVTAEKEGYPVYVSPDLVVVDRPVRHNIPLGYRIFLPLVLKN